MVTLDVDKCLHIEKILDKIKSRWCCLGIRYRESASMNGYHVDITCADSDCWLCRMVFDDELRWYLDNTNREKHHQGILWDSKHYYKGGKYLELKAGLWKPHLSAELNTPPVNDADKGNPNIP